jgi:hypothetical protein
MPHFGDLPDIRWEVRNKAMASPQYREVMPEDSLDVEGHQKAPDYTFRVGTLRKFYAEAKKCGSTSARTPPRPSGSAGTDGARSAHSPLDRL